MYRLFPSLIRFCFVLLVPGILLSNAWFLNNAWADDIPALSSWINKEPTDTLDKINFFEHPFFIGPFSKDYPKIF